MVDAAEILAVFLNDVLSEVAESGTPLVHFYGVAFAIGAPFLMGRSYGDVAKELGVTKQAIGKISIDFCRKTGLPPSSYMRTNQQIHNRCLQPTT